jgi:chemotaxis protein histidine kinase CheA
MTTRTSIVDSTTALTDAVRPALADESSSAGGLSTAAGALRDLAESAREAGLWHVVEGAELLARLVELARSLSLDPAEPDLEVRRSLLAFVGQSLDVLDTAGDSEDERLRLQLMCDAARSAWGEYLEILENSSPDLFSLLGDPWSSEAPDPCAPCANFDLPTVAESVAHVAAPDQVGMILSALGNAAPAGAAIAPPEVKDRHREKPRHTERPAAAAKHATAVAAPSPPPVCDLEIDAELLAAYVDDASRCLSGIEQSVLRLECEPHDQSAVQQIARELHTLKGASASVGLNELAHYLHQVEDFSGNLFACGNVSASLDPLLAAVDAARTQMHALGGGINEVGSACRAESPSPAAATGTPAVVARPAGGAKKSDETLRVEASRIDRLMDLLAELVILRNDREPAQRALSAQHDELGRIIRDFRQELIELRRVPVSGLFQRLVRAARDAARVEKKTVNVRLVGEHTGIERSLQERLYEPLLHLVRNAASHGIEDERVRTSAGKTPGGTVTLEARGGLSALVILVSDDGRGLDVDAIRQRGIELGLLDPLQSATEAELFRLIFHPGFSTCRKTTELSGRGVGMDVVARALEGLRGRVDVDSVRGGGTTVRLTIPLYSVIEHTMIFRIGGQLFALPMHALDAANGNSTSAGGRGAGDAAVIALQELLSAVPGHGGRASVNPEPTSGSGRERLLFIRNWSQPEAGAASACPKRVALAVDEILGPEEVVVRPLPPVLKKHQLFAGATLAAGGQTVLLFESQRLIDAARSRRDDGTPQDLQRGSFERNEAR